MVNQRCTLNEAKNGRGFMTYFDMTSAIVWLTITYNIWCSNQIKCVFLTRQQKQKKKQKQKRKSKKDKKEEMIWLTSSYYMSEFISSENGLSLWNQMKDNRISSQVKCFISIINQEWRKNKHIRFPFHRTTIVYVKTLYPLQWSVPTSI